MAVVPTLKRLEEVLERTSELLARKRDEHYFDNTRAMAKVLAHLTKNRTILS